MWPVLASFDIFGRFSVRIESYYVLWGIAICAMVLWTRRRAARIYGIAEDDAADVLRWVMCGALIGAMLGGYLDHWARFASDPARILRFWESGLSSGPGFIGGGLFGVYRMKRDGISVDRFAESSSIPCCVMLFIGRWGCFLNGCCEGLPTNSALGVRFPRSPGTPALPSQLFESAGALAIGALLAAIEKKRACRPESLGHAVLMPLFLVSYGSLRIALDFLRAGDRIFLLGTGQYSGIIACAVGFLWLARSRRRMGMG
ncbi:MAG: prolipoprotein diacylglyceryl transferase [Synergistaceae bacterium]|jgi:phosphatidylglycerol:prolipoprotein diacylglycerol transferase|nr:prolipoprotein diacylglyceryl transferase [Synergistaceae bacterium]